jgi:hypothetical protein
VYRLSWVAPVPDTTARVPPFIASCQFVNVHDANENAMLPARSVVAYFTGSNNSATRIGSTVVEYENVDPSSEGPHGTHAAAHGSVNLLPATVMVGTAVPSGALRRNPGSVNRFGIGIVGMYFSCSDRP